MRLRQDRSAKVMGDGQLPITHYLHQDCLTASMSSSILTSSPTRKPPASSGAFQVRSKSLRSSSVCAVQEATSVPNGVLPPPSYSASNVTGRVTPRIVRSPITRNWLSPLGVTDVDAKVIVGFSPVPKKSLVRRWPSRCASLVSMLSALISTETRPSVRLSPSVSIVPESSVNRPRTLVNMCRTVNDAPEWLGSIIQTVLPAVLEPAEVAACVALMPRLLNRKSTIYQSHRHIDARTGPQYWRRGTLYRKLLTF